MPPKVSIWRRSWGSKLDMSETRNLVFLTSAVFRILLFFVSKPWFWEWSDLDDLKQCLIGLVRWVVPSDYERCLAQQG